MRAVNVTKLRNHLSKYLSSMQKGHEILVTSHGQVIARLMPHVDTQVNAQIQLQKLRKHCIIGDVVSSLNEEWDADRIP